MPSLVDLYWAERHRPAGFSAVVTSVNDDETVDVELRPGALLPGLNCVSSMYTARAVGDVVFVMHVQEGQMLVLDKFAPTS